MRIKGYQAPKDLTQCLTHIRYLTEAGNLDRDSGEIKFQDIIKINEILWHPGHYTCCDE